MNDDRPVTSCGGAAWRRRVHCRSSSLWTRRREIAALLPFWLKWKKRRRNFLGENVKRNRIAAVSRTEILFCCLYVRSRPGRRRRRAGLEGVGWFITSQLNYSPLFIYQNEFIHFVCFMHDAWRNEKMPQCLACHWFRVRVIAVALFIYDFNWATR